MLFYFRFVSWNIVRLCEYCNCQSYMIDEYMCTLFFTEYRSCTTGELTCSEDGACISTTARCDGFPDCLRGSDEHDCGKNRSCITARGFRCYALVQMIFLALSMPKHIQTSFKIYMMIVVVKWVLNIFVYRYLNLKRFVSRVISIFYIQAS
jgi:hypothetical protein